MADYLCALRFGFQNHDLGDLKKSIESPPNIERLALGCIEVDFANQYSLGKPTSSKLGAQKKLLTRLLHRSNLKISATMRTNILLIHVLFVYSTSKDSVLVELLYPKLI